MNGVTQEVAVRLKNRMLSINEEYNAQVPQSESDSSHGTWHRETMDIRNDAHQQVDACSAATLRGISCFSSKLANGDTVALVRRGDCLSSSRARQSR